MQPACLFCDSKKEGKTVKQGCEFVCSSCSNILMQTNSDQLRRYYRNALDKRDRRKATAISIFLPEKPRDFINLAEQAA